MLRRISLAAVVGLFAAAAHAQDAAPTDAQIAHIAYTAGEIDVEAGKQALAKSKNKDVVEFAQLMVRDHVAVNDQALALVKKLGVSPEDNPTSQALSENAASKLSDLGALEGQAFDRAYLKNEIAYHKAVNAALSETLIPAARNPELKSLLETGLELFTDHQHHAEQLAAALK